MSDESMKTVKAWMELRNIQGQDGSVKLQTTRCEEFIQIPEDCFDDDGNIIVSDAIEYVEVWMQEKLFYGVDPVIESDG